MNIVLSPECTPWQIGDPTLHAPVDEQFLETLSGAGFLTFTGPAGLCGGKSETRTVLAIHRGRGTKWELVFRENESDIVSTTTTDLDNATSAVVSWLQGKTLMVAENSLHCVAG